MFYSILYVSTWFVRNPDFSTFVPLRICSFVACIHARWKTFLIFCCLQLISYRCVCYRSILKKVLWTWHTLRYLSDCHLDFVAVTFCCFDPQQVFMFNDFWTDGIRKLCDSEDSRSWSILQSTNPPTSVRQILSGVGIDVLFIGIKCKKPTPPHCASVLCAFSVIVAMYGLYLCLFYVRLNCVIDLCC